MSSTPSDEMPEINEDQVLDILNGVGESPAPPAGASRPRVPWLGATIRPVFQSIPLRPLVAQDVAGPEPLRQPPNLYDPMGEVTRYARDRATQTLLYRIYVRYRHYLLLTRKQLPKLKDAD